GLWFRVLAARYGVERGSLREEGRNGSTWWRECVSKKVGDGSDTFSWTDPWLGGIPLCVKFGRLFELAENKSSTVAKMYQLWWETGGEAWEWRRQLGCGRRRCWECWIGQTDFSHAVLLVPCGH
ncbi:receptor-like kinase, partial [Trifolium medium]|nr:receptor-like kinase [Trifolium medium]